MQSFLRHMKPLKMMGTLMVLGVLTSPNLILFTLPALADQPSTCAVPGKDSTGTLTGIVNSYYPGTGSNVAVGSTSIPVGTINAAGNLTPIAKGDLLIIIQMQDADINSTDTDSYGNGVSGGGNTGSPKTPPAPLGASGWTALNNAGRYEYAVATGPISGGAIPISQGTTYSYRSSAANTVNGNRSYQVVRVPQYTSAAVSGTLTTAAQWNGSSGGIVAVDVKGALIFNPGSVVDVNGLGFRGGGSNPNPYSGAQNVGYRSVSQGSLVGKDAPKGEGIAGTPRIISTVPFGSFNLRSATSTTDLGVSGYPNGDEGRGAPGNAGGGGNEHNSGGGGGANGGNGGLGGRAYQGAADGYVGGFGGTALPPTPTQLFLGGGGGAGDTNDQSRPSGAGGGGGGLVIIRAGTISGSGTINALGADGIDSPLGARPDAGGGGGAGGTVLITAASGSFSGLTVNVNGGVGGDLNTNNTAETDGTGGGGGGGAVYTTSAVAINAGGGNSGIMTNNTTIRNNTSNGSTSGTAGVNQLISASNLPTGISGSSPLCSPSISGTVFNDADGSELQNGTEAGTNGGGLNAVLIDSTNKVVAIAVVAADGTYTFSNTSANTSYTVQITTATATVGATAPAITLPTNWVSTGENLNGAIDGTVNSKIAVSVATANVVGVNFGIEQLPTAVAVNVASQVNPGGTSTVNIPPTSFTSSTDPDGTVTSYRITAFPSNVTSITIGATTYTSASFPGAGVTVLTADLNTIKVDPIDGAVTVGILFKAIDNAVQESSNTATVNVPFTAPIISPPELILLKRITKINGGTIATAPNGSTIDLTQVVAQPDNAATPRNESGDATNPLDLAGNPTGIKWPTTTYPQGSTDAGVIKTGDRIEYTIYFLSIGGKPVTNANLCDWVPTNTIFEPNSYGIGKGIQLAIGSIITPFTNVPDGDRGVFYNPGATPPATYPNSATYKLNCMTPAGTDGAVVVNLVNNALAAPENQLPNATAAGTPGNSYGFVRFVSKVK